ncbi:DNA-binding SARP family transcriptional activator [Kutzneria viridogrisea]|uniref:DNA-binding SARP family transcriptional activator n=1 Tax=Kutzneria viridogrisea TaxID=47990 RepID=A0ABR6BYS9_9PSEU|nr:AfsR/SARP family transcriptional regulator [Kutzneria albida]MBA8932068.1 DNA-binding SARP family transcriptional activator [Kutzneria viridogrisea]
MRHRKPRALLSLLLLRSGTWVSVGTIRQVLWGGSAPRSSASNIKTYVSQLRRDLPPRMPMGRIESRAGEYRILVEPDELDVTCFEKLVDMGGEQLRGGRPEQAAGNLREALDLWRGEPYDELPDEVVRSERAYLSEHLRAASEDMVDARITLGHSGAVIPLLRSLTTEHPTRERPWAQLLTALCRTGRRAEALSAYQAIYHLLNSELGIEPGLELQRIHQEILTVGAVADSPALSAR